MYTTVDIMPELKKNILSFGYGINFKYEGMLLHSLDRFYVMTKFVLPKIEDLKFTTIKFDSSCKYLDTGRKKNNYPSNYIPNLMVYCKEIVSYINLYKKKTDYYNCTAYEILTKEVSLILPTFPKDKRYMRYYCITYHRFIGLAYKGISSFLHHKWQNALHKAFMAMEKKVDMQRNEICNLEDSMVMYGIFNSDILE